jgi:RNA polymerase sigma factor (sigma-70 family)
VTEPLEDLVERAAKGEQRAWDGLVDRFGGLVWAVARAHRLAASDAADVVQTTWLRLLEHLDDIREPQRLGAWLATTSKRESLRVLRRADRVTPVEGEQLEVDTDDTPGPEHLAVASAVDRVVWRALARLSERCQVMLRMLMTDPPPSYTDVGRVLDMPVGSIGPTRQRCLVRLRAEVEKAGVQVSALR